MPTYFDEFKRGQSGQLLEAGIEERRGRVVGVRARQPVHDALRLGRPVGRREREPVVRAGVHRVHLRQRAIE